MDLIYADENLEDIGVLMDYEFDLAFGKDENNFECKIGLDDHCCKNGYFLYIENTEYGGIVDNISVNTEEKEVVYGGRTWHGVLENKVIEPDSGEDYLILSGDANMVLDKIIRRVGLSDLFSASTEDSEIEIVEYQFRYSNAYTSVVKMLREFDGKLNVVFRNKKVILSALPSIDYSQDEEWDSSQISFEIKKDYKPINHIICLGGGELKDRRVIHLFTDENGGVQPYSITDIPMQDSDYVLDKTKQLITGKEEVTEIYDYPNAQVTENYIVLSSEPTDWENKFYNYYELKSEDYTQLENNMVDVYALQEMAPYDWNVNYKDYYSRSGDTYTSIADAATTIYQLQTQKPSDWKKNYKNYFKKNGNSYANVKAEEEIQYVKKKKQPSDWKKNYKNYYYYYSDGTSEEYRTVNPVTKYKYVPQTRKPSDWKENYNSYYKKKKTGGYEALNSEKAPTWKAKFYYTKKSYQVAPIWKNETYYNAKKEVMAPVWKAGSYYTKKLENTPKWTAHTYYTKTKQIDRPEWASGKYYKKVYDNFAELVNGGLSLLKNSYDCDSISIQLDPKKIYDVGDIVGSYENITGIAIWQPISKKIVNMRDNKVEIEYEIGGY